MQRSSDTVQSHAQLSCSAKEMHSNTGKKQIRVPEEPEEVEEPQV